MNNAEKTLKISILGKNYTVVTDERDTDVYAAASIVENLYQAKGIHGSAGQTQQIEKFAVIATLQVAMDLVKARNLLEQYESACGGLVNVIEKSL